MLRFATPGLLASVITGLLAGCGAGSDALSKADFVSQADALCKSANAKLDADPDVTSVDSFKGYFTDLLKVADDTTSDLEKLAADQPDKDMIQKIFLTPLRGQVDALRDFQPKIDEATKNGLEGLADLEEPDTPEADLDAMKSYGFTDCVDTAEK